MIDVIQRIEVALGAKYPASFHARADELVTLAASARFSRAFPATKLVRDAEAARAARKEVGGRLLPFMRSEAAHPDIYAFEPGGAGPEPKVVVWCVHTTVHDWPDFAQFLSWLRETCDSLGRRSTL